MRIVIEIVDTYSMNISTDFTIVPDEYSKAAPEQNKIGGVPVVSFPFYIDNLDPRAHYLHWRFVDDDAIPVCGFEWIHWTVANVPVEALMFDFNDSHALQIPADFSRTMSAMIPEALQGRNSQASRFVGCTDPSVTTRYNGPQPPDKDHEYMLEVFGSERPLPHLQQGFYMNELLCEVRNSGTVVDAGGMFLTGRA